MVLNLAFLIDLTGELNGLNLELQGGNKVVVSKISSVTTFKSKLKLMSTWLQGGDLCNFSRIQQELKLQDKCVNVIKTIVEIPCQNSA